jgi:hypothetical protein
MKLSPPRLVFGLLVLAIAEVGGCGGGSSTGGDGGQAGMTGSAGHGSNGSMSQGSAGSAGHGSAGSMGQGSAGSAGHGSAGTTGAAGQGGGGSTGSAGHGAGGAGGAASCDDLAAQYMTALTAAQACTVGAAGQCTMQASTSLSPCFLNCMTYVQDATTLTDLKGRWMAAGCDAKPQVCPAIACLQPTAAACSAAAGAGMCVSAAPFAN